MLAPNTTTNAALSIEEAVYYRKVFEDSPESLGKSQINETLTFSIQLCHWQITNSITCKSLTIGSTKLQSSQH